jgi:hypothetical protein
MTPTANGFGTWAVVPTLGAPACSAWLVIVDLATCGVSAAVEVP